MHGPNGRRGPYEARGRTAYVAGLVAAPHRSRYRLPIITGAVGGKLIQSIDVLEDVLTAARGP